MLHIICFEWYDWIDQRKCRHQHRLAGNESITMQDIRTIDSPWGQIRRRLKLSGWKNNDLSMSAIINEALRSMAPRQGAVRALLNTLKRRQTLVNLP